MKRVLFLIVPLGGLIVLATGRASTVDVDAAARFFDQVKPVLDAKCIQCHGPDKQKGKLRLDSLDAAKKGGETGPAIVPGDPEKSLLVQAIRHTNAKLQMPPKEKLKDEQIAALTAWVKDGATWYDRTLVLFEDEEEIIGALKEGGGKAQLDRQDKFRGAAALVVSGQRQAPNLPGWSIPIREKPGPGAYRYIRFAWKKRGGGAIYFELANNGQWRTDQKQNNAAWIAGANTTGWAAFSIADRAPEQWTVVTRDLWQDGGTWKDFTLTGICLTAVDGGEACLDSVILGPTLASLDAYAPGRGQLAGTTATLARTGDAWSDPNNPIRKIFKGERLDLWSLKKPVQPELPAVKNAAWARTPIDRFILARLEAKGLAPSPEADRRMLVRRLYFDLIGLPPTPEEMAAVLADRSEDWYDKLVDKLLASPRYGERWARHWLDVVRYADTNGFERDEYRPLMWQYRDYVIRSFNQDKPYDQFIREQLAGDELLSGPPRDRAEADRLIATGFLRLGQFDSTRGLFGEDKKGQDELMADLVNTTGSAYLGLTFACCQCHDHKYDPLSQADHYRMRAFFAAVKFHDDLVVEPPEVLAEIARHNTAIDQQLAELQAKIDVLLDPVRRKIVEERKAKLPPEIIELLKVEEAKRDEATKKKLEPFLAKLKVKDADASAGLAEAEKKQYAELAKQVSDTVSKKRQPARAIGMTDAGGSAPTTRIFFQGDFTQPREEVPPAFPSVLFPNAAAIKPPSKSSTGRRLALASWIAAADNPWTARVMVNRLWQHHFGKGIVATPGDLGYSGSRPSHPELLDYLATHFANEGWSLKNMHRLMVRSAAYRQVSVDDAKRRALDPDNTLLWRQNVQRLNAETLRDSLLSVSGLLLHNDGGKPLWPPVPEEIRHAQPAILEADKGGDSGRMQGWYADPLEKTDVRSIFLIQKRCLPIPFLQAFDLPDPTLSCSRRHVTTVAPQALTLLNSPEAVRYARAFADRIAKEAGVEPEKRVERAVWRALGRAPDAEEKKLALDLLQRHTEAHRKAAKQGAPTPEQLALVDLCRALMNLNEFVYID
jgi:mono/diheme cytochrome c family protein